jgi:D-alanine-D-alanine ligase
VNQGKLRVAVFFGGRSVEHGVSIVTAAQVMGVMDRARYELLRVYAAERGDYWLVPEFQVSDFATLPLNPAAFDAFARSKGRRLLVSAEKGQLLAAVRSTPGIGERLSPVDVDVAFAIVHGTHGEDGSLQGVFELADVPYVGPSMVPAAVAMDKIVAKTAFAGMGLPVVEGFWFEREAWRTQQGSLKEKALTLGWPLFVKPATLGSSIGVSRATDENELAFAVDTVLSYDRRCVVERSVEGGMDINVSLMRDARGVHVSACERPVKDDAVLDYTQKYLRGGKQEGMAAARRVIPADIPDDVAASVQEMARKAYTELSLDGVARIDFLVSPSDWTVYINEINAIPGSLALYFWELEGIPSGEVIDRIVQQALSAHAEKQRTIYSLTQLNR